MISTDLTALRELTSGASLRLAAACVCCNSVLVGYGVCATRNRLEHFWAQVLHETGGLRRAEENLSYGAERILVVFRSHFSSIAEARLYAHNPRLLANKVYGNRLGNYMPEDGWTFRGRGLLQITGRANYARISAALGFDFTKEPEKVLHVDYALSVAAHIWKSSNCNQFADLDDIEEVTRAINGGLNGLIDRIAWREKTRMLVTEAPSEETSTPQS